MAAQPSCQRPCGRVREAGAGAPRRGACNAAPSPGCLITLERARPAPLKPRSHFLCASAIGPAAPASRRWAPGSAPVSLPGALHARARPRAAPSTLNGIDPCTLPSAGSAVPYWIDDPLIELSTTHIREELELEISRQVRPGRGQGEPWRHDSTQVAAHIAACPLSRQGGRQLLAPGPPPVNATTGVRSLWSSIRVAFRPARPPRPLSRAERGPGGGAARRQPARRQPARRSRAAAPAGGAGRRLPQGHPAVGCVLCWSDATPAPTALPPLPPPPSTSSAEPAAAAPYDPRPRGDPLTLDP